MEYITEEESLFEKMLFGYQITHIDNEGNIRFVSVKEVFKKQTKEDSDKSPKLWNDLTTNNG